MVGDLTVHTNLASKLVACNGCHQHQRGWQRELVVSQNVPSGLTVSIVDDRFSFDRLWKLLKFYWTENAFFVNFLEF